MWANVWFVIWPNQKIVIQNAVDTARGQARQSRRPPRRARAPASPRAPTRCSPSRCSSSWARRATCACPCREVGRGVLGDRAGHPGSPSRSNALKGTPGKGAAKPLATVSRHPLGGLHRLGRSTTSSSRSCAETLSGRRRTPRSPRSRGRAWSGAAAAAGRPRYATAEERGRGAAVVRSARSGSARHHLRWAASACSPAGSYPAHHSASSEPGTIPLTGGPERPVRRVAVVAGDALGQVDLPPPLGSPAAERAGGRCRVGSACRARARTSRRATWRGLRPGRWPGQEIRGDDSHRPPPRSGPGRRSPVSARARRGSLADGRPRGPPGPRGRPARRSAGKRKRTKWTALSLPFSSSECPASNSPATAWLRPTWNQTCGPRSMPMKRSSIGLDPASLSSISMNSVADSSPGPGRSAL